MLASGLLSKTGLTDPRAARVCGYAARLCALTIAAALGVMAWQGGAASGEQVVVRVAAPAVWSPDAGSFDVRVEVEGAVDVAAFEFRLSFDPAVVGFEGAEVSSFLGSTGRAVDCSDAEYVTPQFDIISFACSTEGDARPGPSGAGVLASVRFRPVGGGPSPLALPLITLVNTQGETISVVVEDASIIIGRSAGPPVPTPTPVGGTPAAGAATATPEGYDTLLLVAGCNFTTNTIPGSTDVRTVAAAVSPPGILDSLWRSGPEGWFGFSPRYPGASDLGELEFAQTLFVCVSGPGRFLRPIV